MTETHDESSRKIGIEIEYAGVNVEATSRIIQKLYGGKIKPNSNAEMTISETSLGDFNVELDARLVKKLEEYNAKLDAESKPNNIFTRLYATLTKYLSRTVTETSENLVPYEVVCPPIAISKIGDLNVLTTALRQHGAEGTNAKPLYAFGLHLNPEVSSTQVDYLLRHLQSFLLLEEWLLKKHQVNQTRLIAPFIDPFPNDYKVIVLQNSYQPSIENFFKDYSTFNPTRNRALDLLPLLQHTNDSLYKKYFDSDIKNNPRPTFHYRLPNCDIDNPDWSIESEYQTWLTVEKLSRNPDILNETIAQWARQQHQLKQSSDDWVAHINQIIESKL